MNTRQSSFGGITGVIFVVGLIATFAFGGFNLSIFFATLAFCSLFGTLSSGKPGSLYGGFSGFIWLMALALFFTTGTWLVFPLAILAMIFIRPIVSTLIGTFTGMGLYNRMQPPQQTYYQPSQPPQQPYYQPSQQPGYHQPQAQQPYTPYEGGYQQPAAKTYQEAGQNYHYPPQPEQTAEEKYSQPQAQYPPQQMPPQ